MTVKKTDFELLIDALPRIYKKTPATLAQEEYTRREAFYDAQRLDETAQKVLIADKGSAVTFTSLAEQGLLLESQNIQPFSNNRYAIVLDRDQYRGLLRSLGAMLSVPCSSKAEDPELNPAEIWLVEKVVKGAKYEGYVRDFLIYVSQVDRPNLNHNY
jgi:hypothetical protein